MRVVTFSALAHRVASVADEGVDGVAAPATPDVPTMPAAPRANEPETAATAMTLRTIMCSSFLFPLLSPGWSLCPLCRSNVRKL